ncbi:hypothetical protein MUO66_02945 [Candidatus Bathyarchaeota archaeon]|nr:hypothetical protein [Candidatus Bathyarchaeota archaeon]
MLRVITKLLRNKKRGISTVIVVMLSLVLIVTIVGNVILWSYQMNQVDWEKMQESIKIINVQETALGVLITFQNDGSLTSHVTSLWVTNSTIHQRYEIGTFISPGETTSELFEIITLPDEPYMTKVSTERGNLSVFSTD